jgi:hypothetical protein
VIYTVKNEDNGKPISRTKFAAVFQQDRARKGKDDTIFAEE